MPDPHLHVFRSLAELEGEVDRWDDLWRRSDVTPPTARLEHLRHWLDCFGPTRQFRALVVEQDGQWVAGLPLLTRRWARIIPCGSLPRNEWSGAGDLLVDGSTDSMPALRLLASALNQFVWPLYRFSFIQSATPPWVRFRTALAEAGLKHELRPSHDVTYIPIGHDWEAFRRTWSKNHRRRMTRLLRRLEEQGRVRLALHAPRSQAEVQPLVQRALEIENSGWKGRAGTSLLKSPHIADYVHQTSNLLALTGEFEVAFLELNDQPIAFELLWNSKGVLHSYKVGYDEAYERFDPGHLLMHELLRDAFERQRCVGYDCLGPVSVATRQWRGTSYSVSQLTVAPCRLSSRILLRAYQHLVDRKPTPSAPQSELDPTVNASNEPTDPDNCLVDASDSELVSASSR